MAIVSEQLDLIPRERVWELPQDYEPEVPAGLHVNQIFLCRGSLDTPQRERFVRRICSVFPTAKASEQFDTVHNRVELHEPEPMHRVALGKQTLTFGELSPKHAVWDGRGQEAPYLHRRRLSLCGFCFYACRFCYLAGRDAVWHSPTVKIFVNLTEIMDEVERHIRRAEQPLELCIGELQDGLSLDPLTAYSSVLVPFFAKQRDACLEIRTKSTAVERLLSLNHGQRTLLSWTLNQPEVARVFEVRAPPVEERIMAMRRCAGAGNGTIRQHSAGTCSGRSGGWPKGYNRAFGWRSSSHERFAWSGSRGRETEKVHCRVWSRRAACNAPNPRPRQYPPRYGLAHNRSNSSTVASTISWPPTCPTRLLLIVAP